MRYLNLTTIKHHLQIESGYTADDTYLEMLGGCCEEVVGKVIDDELSGLAESNNGVLPLPLQQAALLLLGEYYSNREVNAYGISVNQIPLSFTYLTDLYRNYAGSENDMNKLIEELNNKVEQLTAYMQFDSNRVITGEDGVTVTTTDSGETTTIGVDEIDGGEY